MYKKINFILIMLCLSLSLRIIYLNNKNNELIGNNTELSEKLKSQIIITKEKIVYKYRDGDNAKEKNFYVPSEGSIEIITPKDNENVKPSKIDNLFNQIIEQTDGSLIMIQNKGFCLAPEISANYSKEFEAGLQLRLLYWNRYNAGIGITHKETVFIYGSRNLSDIFNFTRNTSLQVGIGKNFKENDTRFLIGLGVRL